MSSSDNDEDFKLAMALPMQDSHTAAKTNTAVLDLTSDNEGEEDDNDLQRAIALSLQEDSQSSDPTAPANLLASHEPPTSTITPPVPELTQQDANFSTGESQSARAIILDRKVMEQERLARLEQRKRKRSASPDQPSKQLSRESIPTVEKDNAVSSEADSDLVLQYPRGVIKRTFATKFPRTDDITIDELLQAPMVNFAVTSSFQWDANWLNRKLSHNKVKQIWVMNARDADTQARWRQEMANCGVPNLRIHFPPMNPVVGNSHSKYMFLSSEKKLRLVVSTANMEPVYWGEVNNNWQPGVLENSAFIIDLPRRTEGIEGNKKDLTPFGKDLMHFLEAQQLDSKVVNSLLKFDFSQTSNLGFVHSLGGLSDAVSHPTGLPGLTKTIQELKLDKVRSLELDYATSSLGAIDDTFLQRVYLAAHGVSFTIGAVATAHVRQNFRIYYPTQETVKASIGGPDCAGVISLQKSHFSSPTFPAECLRDYVSTRKGMLSHNKLLFARGRHTNGKPFAWAYVGSANLSESAWGAQKVLKSGKLGKLTVRNWECGVVVPVPAEKLEALKLDDGQTPPMSVFEGTVEVPFQYPGEAYNGRLPHYRTV